MSLIIKEVIFNKETHDYCYFLIGCFNIELDLFLKSLFVDRFVDAILLPHIRERYVHLPTEEEMQENMTAIEDKYNLPNVVGGVDGCHFSFREKPRYYHIHTNIVTNFILQIGKFLMTEMLSNSEIGRGSSALMLWSLVYLQIVCICVLKASPLGGFNRKIHDNVLSAPGKNVHI